MVVVDQSGQFVNGHLEGLHGREAGVVEFMLGLGDGLPCTV